MDVNKKPRQFKGKAPMRYTFITNKLMRFKYVVLGDKMGLDENVTVVSYTTTEC